MKKVLLILCLSSLLFPAMSSVYAFCDEANPCDATDDQSACQCVDRGCRRNNCLEKSDCCQAFGNIGER